MGRAEVRMMAELYVFVGIIGFAMALIIVMMWRDDD